MSYLWGPEAGKITIECFEPTSIRKKLLVALNSLLATAADLRNYIYIYIYVKAVLQELEDPVFTAPGNAEISALVQQAAEVFEDCLCFLTGFHKMTV